MKKVKVLTAAIMLGLFGTPMISVNAGTIPNPVYHGEGEGAGAVQTLPAPLPAISATTINLPADYYILDTREADVTGDGITDTIYLAGHKVQTNASYTDDLNITVENGADKSLIIFPLDAVSGYQSSLFAGDFTGDQIADVYVETASGGSGGWSYHNIVSFYGAEPKEIFGSKENVAANVTGKFVDGWTVALTNHTDGKTLSVGVKERRQDYLRLGIYDTKGKVQRETQIMSAPFSRLEPIDLDHDGVFELKGIQSLSGAYRADRLADVETIFKYMGAAWQSESMLIMASSVTNADSAGTDLDAQGISAAKQGITD